MLKRTFVILAFLNKFVPYNPKIATIFGPCNQCFILHRLSKVRDFEERRARCGANFRCIKMFRSKIWNYRLSTFDYRLFTFKSKHIQSSNIQMWMRQHRADCCVYLVVWTTDALACARTHAKIRRWYLKRLVSIRMSEMYVIFGVVVGWQRSLACARTHAKLRQWCLKEWHPCTQQKTCPN